MDRRTLTAGAWLFFVGFQIAMAAVAVWLVKYTDYGAAWPQEWRPLPTAIALSQGALLGCWIAFGNRWIPWRLLLVTCAVAGGAQLLTAYSERIFPYLSFGYLLQPLTTSALFLGIRVVGGPQTSMAAASPNLHPGQFSLRRLFLWTAVVASVAVMLRSTSATADVLAFFARYGRDDPKMFVEVVSFAVLATVTWFVVFGIQKPMLRLTAFPIAIIVAIAVDSLLTPGRHLQMLLSQVSMGYIGYPILLLSWFIWVRILLSRGER